jgi:subtilisin family serine protease
MRVGIVDTGVNPWHSHVRAPVDGCRIQADAGGRILKDEDFRDHIGHGTAVAGVIRAGAPQAQIYAVNVFGNRSTTYPSLVARGIQEALAAGCDIVVLCLSLPDAPGSPALMRACSEARKAGAVLVAAGDPERPARLPAAHPDVIGVVADDSLGESEVVTGYPGPFPIACYGGPRDLPGVPRGSNLRGHSFACARYAAELARLNLARFPTSDDRAVDDDSGA